MQMMMLVNLLKGLHLESNGKDQEMVTKMISHILQFILLRTLRKESSMDKNGLFST